MIAFTCASYVQLIRAFQMHMYIEEYKGEADLYLVYPMFQKENMIYRIRKTGIFKNVFYIDTALEGHLKLLKTKHVFDKVTNNTCYTRIVSFNIENITACLLYNRCKSIEGFEFHFCEDAPTVYKVYIPDTSKKLDIYKAMHLERECFHIDKWWSSFPDIMEVPPVFTNNVIKIPPIDINNRDLLKVLNYVFAYNDIPELNNTDMLIMEESHFTDGLLPDNYDFYLYESIKNRYAEKNIYIKLHPRTKINRFNGIIDLLPSSDLPWELIAWNRIINNPKPLLQIGISCSTLVSDKALFDYEGPKIVLMKMFKDKILPTNGSYRVDKQLIKDHEKIKQTFREPDNFMMPESKTEIYSILDELL